MTIKQQGGVFGRNPTFNDVTVDGTLTVDGSSTHSGGISAGNISVSGNTIASTNTNGDINLSPNGAGDVVVAASVVITEANNSVTAVDAAMLDWFSDHARLISSQNGVGDGDIQFYVTSAGAVALAGTFTTAGNLAFPSGQGIDFSATAGAGTSELFDDYEEGTWTPVLSDGTNNATMSANSAGSYTKIGRLIVLNATVETTSLGSVTGAIRITGLPYSNLTGIPFYASGVAGYGELLNITAGQSVGLAINSGNAHINLNLWDAAGGITPMQASEWSADGVITFSISYFGA